MEAIVLSRYDFREYDQIISLYTPDYGRKEVLAKGVKKIISKNSAYLEPFSFIDVEIIFGKELDYIGSVQSINYFKNIRQNLEKSICAGFILDVFNKLISAEEKDEQLFTLLKSFLSFLNSYTFVCHSEESKDLYSITDAFIAKLLYLLGFGEEEWQAIIAQDWGEIVNTNFKENMHHLIYQSLVVNTEINFRDWR